MQRRSIPSVLVDVGADSSGLATGHFLTLKDCYNRRGSAGRALPQIPVEPSRSMLDLPHSRKSSAHSLDIPMEQPRRASAPEGENIRIVIDEVQDVTGSHQELLISGAGGVVQDGNYSRSASAGSGRRSSGAIMPQTTVVTQVRSLTHSLTRSLTLANVMSATYLLFTCTCSSLGAGCASRANLVPAANALPADSSGVYRDALRTDHLAPRRTGSLQSHAWLWPGSGRRKAERPGRHALRVRQLDQAWWAGGQTGPETGRQDTGVVQQVTGQLQLRTGLPYHGQLRGKRRAYC